jgi:hypothetical protein
MAKMKDAAAFQASYSDWKLIRTRKCVQIVFEVPMETADTAYQALGGMPNPAAESWFAIARLMQPTGKGVEAETTNDTSETALPASVKPPVRAPRNKLAQLAGMLSKTPLFHRYVEATTTSRNVTEEMAAEFIRGRSGVRSRAEIVRGSDVGDEFLKLYDDFVLWSEADKFVEAGTADRS